MILDLYKANHIQLVVIHLCQWVEYDTGHIQGQPYSTCCTLSMSMGRVGYRTYKCSPYSTCCNLSMSIDRV